MKKLIILIAFIGIALNSSAQAYNYRVTANKFRVGSFKVDTCYISVVQITQMRFDTLTNIQANLYTDSLDMATNQNHFIAISASWKGFSTLARQNDSIIAVLSRKFGINKNKFVAQ